MGVRAGVPTTTMGCPFLWACTRTALEQCNPHQRQGHLSGVRIRAGRSSGVPARSLARTGRASCATSCTRTDIRSRCTLGCVGRCQSGWHLQQTFPGVAELPVPDARKIQRSDKSVWRPLHNGVNGHDSLMETRGWKLYILLPSMLLRGPRGHAKMGKDELS